MSDASIQTLCDRIALLEERVGTLEKLFDERLFKKIVLKSEDIKRVALDGPIKPRHL